jgi:hypothetical protein
MSGEGWSYPCNEATLLHGSVTSYAGHPPDLSPAQPFTVHGKLFHLTPFLR